MVEPVWTGMACTPERPTWFKAWLPETHMVPPLLPQNFMALALRVAPFYLTVDFLPPLNPGPTQARPHPDT